MSKDNMEDNPSLNILNGTEANIPLNVFNSEDFAKYASTMLQNRTCVKMIPPKDEIVDDDDNLELKSLVNEPKLYDMVCAYIAENQKNQNFGIADFEKFKIKYMGGQLHRLSRTTKYVNELRKIDQSVENKPFIELLNLLKRSALENPHDDYLNGIRATMTESIFDKMNGLETGITDEWNLSKIGERFQMKSKTVMSSGYFLSPLTVEPFGLPKASYLIPFSRPMLWIIISPEGLSILNQAFKHVRGKCETPINHCCYITDIEKFQSLGIEPTFILQQPNEFVAIAPGCCYQTISFGVTVSEECNFHTGQVISSCMEMKRCVCKPVVRRCEKIPRTVPALTLELEIGMMNALHGPNARLKNSVALRLMKELDTAEATENDSNGGDDVRRIAIEQPHVTVIVDEPLQEEPRSTQHHHSNGIEPQTGSNTILQTQEIVEPSESIQSQHLANDQQIEKDETSSHSEHFVENDTVLQTQTIVEPSESIQPNQQYMNGGEHQIGSDNIAAEHDFADSFSDFMDQESRRSPTPCPDVAPLYFNGMSSIHGDHTAPQPPPQDHPHPPINNDDNGSDYFDGDLTFGDGELPTPNQSFCDEQTNDVNGNGIDEEEEGRGETRPDYEKKARNASSRKTNRSSKRGPRPLKPRQNLEKQHPREPAPQPSPAKNESDNTTQLEDVNESDGEAISSTLNDMARRAIDMVTKGEPEDIDLNEFVPIYLNIEKEPPSISTTGTSQNDVTASQNEAQVGETVAMSTEEENSSTPVTKECQKLQVPVEEDETKTTVMEEEILPTSVQKESQEPDTLEPIEEDETKTTVMEEEILPTSVQKESQEPDTLEPIEEDEVEMVLTMTDFRRGLCKQLQDKVDRKVRYEKMEHKKINREQYDKNRNRETKEMIAKWFKDKIRKLRQNIKNLRTIIKEFNMPGKVHRHYHTIEEAIAAEALKSQDEIALVNSRDLANILKELMKEKRHQNTLLQMFFVGIPMEQIIRDFFNRDDPADRHLFEMAVRAALPKSRHEFYLDIANSKSKWVEHFKVPNDPDYRAPWKDWICDDDAWATAKIGKRKCPTPPASKSSQKKSKTEDSPPSEAMDFKLNGNENLLDPSQCPSEKRFQDMFEPDSIEPVNSQNENGLSSSTASKKTIILSEEESQLDVQREATKTKNIENLNQIQWDSPQDFIDSTLKAFEMDYERLKSARHALIATNEIGICKLRSSSLSTLALGNFISDDIIVAYSKLLVERSMRLSNFPKILTGHIQMKAGKLGREIAREDLRKSGNAQLVKPDIFFGTVVGHLHFILYVVEFATNTYFVYDPLGGDPTIGYGAAINRFNVYIEEIFNCNPEKRQADFIQQQDNGSDCGICCIIAMDQTSRNIQPVRIPTFARKLILCELLCGRLFHEDYQPYDESVLVPLKKSIIKQSSNSQIATQSQQIVPESVKSSRSRSQDSKIQQVKTPMQIDEDLQPLTEGLEKLCCCYVRDSKIPCDVYKLFDDPDGELDAFIGNGNKLFKSSTGKIGPFNLEKRELATSPPSSNLIDRYFEIISNRGKKLNATCHIVPVEWRTSRCPSNIQIQTSANNYVIGIICVPTERDINQIMINHYAAVICDIPRKIIFTYDPFGFDTNTYTPDEIEIQRQFKNIKSYLSCYLKTLHGDSFDTRTGWKYGCPENTSYPLNENVRMSAISVMSYCEQYTRGVRHINIERSARRWKSMKVELAHGELFRQERAIW